jgi:hypothetical protein
MTPIEELVIVKFIIDLDSRGFSPTPRVVRDIANNLREERGLAHVGPNWATRFIKRTPELKSRFQRKYDYQRALCEDPNIIREWFALVRNTIAKYGIQNDDIYNFDETGFAMGIASTYRVVTASERRNKPKTIQPGNREWATVIEGVNAAGWAIPPFIIIKGRAHLSSWYKEPLPAGWVVAVSENGWTTNELGFEWLQHFNKYTEGRKQGGWRLLILDGHESHQTVQFVEYCARNNIITLCMPPHSSHLLQPLDIACFSPLKKAYGHQIGELMRAYINHVTKTEFLSSFIHAHNASFTAENIQAGFRGAGLVPFDPEKVIGRLDIQLRTPSPIVGQNEPWQPKTPQTVSELASQSTFIKSRLARHQDSSPTSINEALNQLTKGAEMMMHSAVILEKQVGALQKANLAASERRSRKRRRIQIGGTITAQNTASASNVVNNRQETGVLRQKGPEVVITRRQQPRCGRCRQTGHRIQTCPIISLDNDE